MMHFNDANASDCVCSFAKLPQIYITNLRYISCDVSAVSEHRDRQKYRIKDRYRTKPETMTGPAA